MLLWLLSTVNMHVTCFMQCVDAVTSAALEEDMQHLRGSRRRQRVSAVPVIDSIREFMNASCLPFAMKLGLVHHAERKPDKSLSFKVHELCVHGLFGSSNSITRTNTSTILLFARSLVRLPYCTRLYSRTTAQAFGLSPLDLNLPKALPA
jgi:hypothetical protein